MNAKRRNVYHRGGNPPHGLPDRHQQLRRVVRAELNLVCGIILKCGAAVLAVKGLLGVAVLSHALVPGSINGVAIAPQIVQAGGPVWPAGKNSAMASLPGAAPVPH